MNKQVVSVEPGKSLQELTDLRLKHKINRLPVVEDGQLIGRITREDILRGLFGIKTA